MRANVPFQLLLCTVYVSADEKRVLKELERWTSLALLVADWSRSSLSFTSGTVNVDQEEKKTELQKRWFDGRGGVGQR